MNNYQTKNQRDKQIMMLLAKFKVCSRNQIAAICFNQNSNPIIVANRVLNRLVTDGSLLSIPRSRDRSYLYTLNPSPISHKSNKIDHQLKIVDFYIQCGCPDNFIVEPILGKYEPDIFYRDKSGKTICVEIQLTPISCKKMQIKLDQFSKEFNKSHDSKTFILCSNNDYNKLEIPKGFSFKKYSIPNEISL